MTTRGKNMAREAKYTKTVAFRVTAEEWAAIARIIEVGAPIWAPQPTVCKTPSQVIRAWITRDVAQAVESMAAEVKRAEAKAKRDEIGRAHV